MNFKQESYAIKNKNVNIQLKSQSGGAFSIFADYVLDNGGYVCGCTMDESLEIKHIIVDNKLDKEKLMHSKYVQSDLKNVYTEIRRLLENNKLVLFSGTPCQVAGLKRYLYNLKVDDSKLLLIDIICHGVPSPGVWRDYIGYLNRNYGNILTINQRDKKFGWDSSITTINTEHGERINNVYNTLFYKHYIVRKSCFSCRFRSLNRVSDLTIGDCWGIKRNAPEFYDKNGVSLVIINSTRGKEFFENNKKKMIIKSIDITKYLQQALKCNYDLPKNIEKFEYDYKTRSFEYIAKKYGEQNIFCYFKRFLKKMIIKFFNK